MHKYNDDLYVTTLVCVDREQNNFDITYNTYYMILVYFLYIFD